jgi:hypothetical protein
MGMSMRYLLVLFAALSLVACGSASKKVDRAADDVTEAPGKVGDRLDEAGDDADQVADEGVEAEAEVKP